MKAKLDSVNPTILKSLSGGKIDSWCSLNATDSSGDILMGWDFERLTLVRKKILTFSITISCETLF